MSTEADRTNTGVVTTIVVVGTFAMIAISALVAAMVRAEHAEVDQRRPTNADLDTVAQLDRDQRAKIDAAPAWIDRERGKLSIPIALAMKLVVDEYATRPEAASPPPPPGLVMNPVPSSPADGTAAPAGAAGTTVAPGAVNPVGTTPASEPAAAPPSAAAPGAVPPAPAPASAPAPVGAQGAAAPATAAPRTAAAAAVPPAQAPPAVASPDSAQPSAAPSAPEPSSPSGTTGAAEPSVQP
jgi:hypothetical protein